MTDARFDLTDCSERRYASTRGLRIEFAAISILLALTGLIIVIYQVAAGTLESSLRVLYGLPYGIAFTGALFMGWGSTKFSPGATRLEVRDDEAIFGFPGGGTTVLRYKDTHFSLDLVDARSSRLAQKYGVAGYARLPRRPPSRLTGEALDSLISKAREQHLVVTTRQQGGRWSLAGPARVLVKIRGPGPRHSKST